MGTIFMACGPTFSASTIADHLPLHSQTWTGHKALFERDGDASGTSLLTTHGLTHPSRAHDWCRQCTGHKGLVTTYTHMRHHRGKMQRAKEDRTTTITQRHFTQNICQSICPCVQFTFSASHFRVQSTRSGDKFGCFVDRPRARGKDLYPKTSTTSKLTHPKHIWPDNTPFILPFSPLSCGPLNVPNHPLPCFAADPVQHRLAVSPELHLVPFALPWYLKNNRIQST